MYAEKTAEMLNEWRSLRTPAQRAPWRRRFRLHVLAALRHGRCPLCDGDLKSDGYFKAAHPIEWVETLVCPRCCVVYDTNPTNADW